MLLPFVQLAVIAAIVLYLCLWRRNVRRRNRESWESLISRLRPEWSARELSDRFLWREGIDTTPEEAWQRMGGPTGLWVMFQNAGVLLAMADYASRNCEGVDRMLVFTLHSDALQIRVCVLSALVQYALTATTEGVRINAYRAASMYIGMAARMTELLQNNAAIMVPNFVEAM